MCKGETTWTESVKEKEREKEGEVVIDDSSAAVKMTDIGVNWGIFMAYRGVTD